MNELTTINTSVTSSSTSMNMFEVMDKAYKYAEIMAQSNIVPESYKNRPANCFIAIMTAYKMNKDPFWLMHGSHIIKGNLSIGAAYAIALANTSGLLKSRIRYKIEGTGNDLRVTAYAKYKNGEEISYDIGMKEAIAEKWTERKRAKDGSDFDSKYNTMPELMLRYRAATFLIRTHMPEVLNGLHILEEANDAEPENTTPSIATVHENRTEAVSSMLDNILIENEEEEEYLGEITYEDFDSSEEISNLEILKDLIVKCNIGNEIIEKWCKHADKSSDTLIETIDQLTDVQRIACINWIGENYELNGGK